MTAMKALAEAVTERRELLGLTQAQVAERRGPSTDTMRLIENRLRKSYSPAVLGRLERALRFQHGVVAKILDGTATSEDLEAVTPDYFLDPATPIPSSGAADAARVIFQNVTDRVLLPAVRPGPDLDQPPVGPDRMIEYLGSIVHETSTHYALGRNDAGIKKFDKTKWLRVDPSTIAEAASASGTGAAHNPTAVTASAPLGGLVARAGGPATMTGLGTISTKLAELAELVHGAPSTPKPDLSHVEAISQVITRLSRDVHTPAVDKAIDALLEAIPDVVAWQRAEARDRAAAGGDR